MAALVALAACTGKGDKGDITVSVIGKTPANVDPNRAPLSAGDAVLANSTAMGLVAFDAGGQIEPALAESWIVTDDGLSYIFRLRRMNWPDGREITGNDVAASLNKAAASVSHNRLKPLMTALDKVVGMTGRVVEIRLRAPRPNLLQLLAQPELGIHRRAFGSGPWLAGSPLGGAVRLTMPPAEGEPETARETMVLRGERAAMALARFNQGNAQAILGGTLADWPIVQASGVRAVRIRQDPAEGLFGLAIADRTTFLKESSLRDALSMAVDRDGIVGAFDVGRWGAIDRLLPSALDSGQPPAQPDWSGQALADRRAVARQRIAAWTAARGPIEPLRVALPPGPGMRLLFAWLSAGWRAVGVGAIAVPMTDKTADLRLIDEVAPNRSANWYLTRTSCDAGLACSATGDFDLKASRLAPSLGQRAAAIGRADAAYAANTPYIPIARPVRWSVIDPALTLFRENAFAVHPLAELRTMRN